MLIRTLAVSSDRLRWSFVHSSWANFSSRLLFLFLVKKKHDQKNQVFLNAISNHSTNLNKQQRNVVSLTSVVVLRRYTHSSLCQVRFEALVIDLEALIPALSEPL
jgi:hypothetical protein